MCEGALLEGAETLGEGADMVSVPVSTNSSNNSRFLFVATRDADALKTKLQEFADELKSKIDRDPTYFGAAVETFLNNRNKYATSNSNLVSGLVTAFKPRAMGVSKKVNSYLHVQPPAIMRRKNASGGKRVALVGRPAMKAAQRLVKAAKRKPRKHDLKQNVLQNVACLPSKPRNVK